MPRLSSWFIRAALLHLGLGVLLGTLILAAKGLPGLFGWAWLLLPAHIQLVTGGWLIQLTLGMAYWILPRLDAAGDRGRSGWAWASFATLNMGVVGAATLLVARSFSATPSLDSLLLPAALLQLMGFVTFMVHAWPRVRATVRPGDPNRTPSAG